jgi:hypothetical protein
MARKRKKHEHFNQVPKFCTTDVQGACHIYELQSKIEGMGTIEALYTCVKMVRYDGTDAMVEDPQGENAKSLFLEIRTGSFLPLHTEGLELTWYEHDDDPNLEINLEEIIVMCAI